MITIQKLKDISPNTIFAKGESEDNENGIHMTGSGKMLKWVAVRGGIHDWAIYTHFSDKDFEWIKCYGDKVHNEETVKRLVPSDDEAFKMYRH